jgi:hypothetical protein
MIKHLSVLKNKKDTFMRTSMIFFPDHTFRNIAGILIKGIPYSTYDDKPECPLQVLVLPIYLHFFPPAQTGFLSLPPFLGPRNNLTSNLPIGTRLFLKYTLQTCRWRQPMKRRYPPTKLYPEDHNLDYHCHEILKFCISIWGRRGIATPFFISPLDESFFTPRERTPGTQWIGGCVGPRVSLDAVEKRNILLLSGIEPRPSSM